MTGDHRESPFRSLRLDEARERRDLLDVTSYDVRLDLRDPDETFRSVTTIRLESRGGRTFLDVKPRSLESVTLDGRPVDPGLLDHGRLPLELTDGSHEIVVDAVMGFRNDGEGLHLHLDPADGRPYVYAMSFMEAAPSWFACFDQPDLKAPYTLHVLAPQDWTVVGNGPAEQVEPGTWELAQTPPLSTYFVTLVAGPWHVLRDEHDGIPLGLSARRSLAADLDADAEELFGLTRACFDEYHRLFGIRYPFGDYHQAFVPEFNAGAMENPGCVTYRDPLVFSSRVTRGERIKRATTVAHEMAHQWFGNITTPVWWDDLWLNESFAEYMGNRVTAEVTEYDDAWVHHAYARRQWGLIADQRPSTHPVAGNGATDAASALQDFDGISYVKGSSILKQLDARLGDEVFFAGVVDHLTRARFGNATMADLLGCWERAGAGDLSGFAEGWLRTAGPDRLVIDRSAGVVRRTPPASSPIDRLHHTSLAAHDGDDWRIEPFEVSAAETPLPVGPDEPVVLDPHEDSWAVTLPDEAALSAYPTLLPATTDPLLRAAIWNGVRSAYHLAEVAPDRVIALAAAWLPAEDNDDAVASTCSWLGREVLPRATDPEGAGRLLHRAAAARLDTAPEGSTLQLAAFQAAASTCSDVTTLRSWLGGGDLPAGVPLDLDLRWRLLRRLAVLGATDTALLQAELDALPSARAAVEHARAVASLPAAGAKEWAWRRFTGEARAANYELEAAGEGMWQPGQEDLTAPYVDRYLAELPAAVGVHAGWVLGTVTEAFFPSTFATPADGAAVVAGAESLLAASDLDPTIRRNLADTADDLRRRVLVAERFG